VYSFRETVPALAAAGYRAIAVDLKGHGLSDKPVARGEYTAPAMAQHVVDILDALGLARVTLVGHSMGGAVAMHVAIATPERVNGLALLSPVGLGPAPALTSLKVLTPQFLNPILPWLVTRFAVKMILSTVYGTLRRPTERDIDEYWAPSQFPSFACAMRELVHHFMWMPVPRAQLEKLRIPTLVMFGSQDPVIAIGPAKDRSAVFPDHRVILVEGSGHVLPEEAPEMVNTALLEVLSAVPR
jgi:pimeloyl-ACP methyl ester carboxylesterase